MPAGPVVTNNSPLAALWAIDQLDLLHRLFQEIWIAPAVADEFVAVARDERLKALAERPWIRTVPLRDPRPRISILGLDRGETQTLALAAEGSASLVIMDERKGRTAARRMKLRLTGTVGVLMLAKDRGLLASVGPWLARLEEHGMYLGSEVIARALALAGEPPIAG